MVVHRRGRGVRREEGEEEEEDKMVVGGVGGRSG